MLRLASIFAVSVPVACGMACLLIDAEARAIDGQYPLAGTCEYPTEVMVQSIPSPDHPVPELASAEFALCSGAYLGTDGSNSDGVFITAGHCVAHMDWVTVSFGEELGSSSYTANASCTLYPDGEWVDKGTVTSSWVFTGVDLAVCTLDDGGPDLLLAPVLIPDSCENAYVREQLFSGGSPYGVPAEFVGNGLEGSAGSTTGRKRHATGRVQYEFFDTATNSLRVNSLQPGQEADGNSAAIAVRPGDSGGPLYFEMANGTARIIGINVQTDRRNENLNGAGEKIRFTVESTPVPRYNHWIETTAGAGDITPCFDYVSGEWVQNAPAFCYATYDQHLGANGSSWATDCLDVGNHSYGECAGWIPSGSPDKGTAPTDAEVLLEFLLTADPDASTRHFGGVPQLPLFVGTLGDDAITELDRSGNQVMTGVGHDRVFTGTGPDEIHGGSGNDLLFGAEGDDTFVPGRGADYIEAGPGDDVIVISGTCEIEYGELYDGGPGYDVIHAPLGRQDLKDLGVDLVSVEEVILNHPSADSLLCSSDTPTEVYYE